MTYTDQAIVLGKTLIGKVALEITPDESIAVINEFVLTATDLEMSGKEKFDWVVAKVLDMALDVWDLILPLIVQALYELMMASVKSASNAQIGMGDNG